MAKKYFHNFNGIRFYLASYIIFFHIEEIKSVLKLPTYFHDYKFLNPFATTAITMFFTLSGFLISYFLFIEKEKHPEYSEFGRCISSVLLSTGCGCRIHFYSRSQTLYSLQMFIR